MTKLVFCLLAWAITLDAGAETVSEMQRRAESSMVVTGTVDISPDGTVTSHTLDHRDKLPAIVADLVDRAAARWHFQEDLTKSPTARHTDMTLRIVARHQTDGTYKTRIVAASFGSHASDEDLEAKSIQRPQYPPYAIWNRIQGTVHLLVRVDRNGVVTDVTSEEVDLDTVATESVIKQIRKQFAESSVRAAKSWTFTVHRLSNQPDGAWVVRIPATFAMQEFGKPDANVGKWLVYVPGPKEDAAWLAKYGYEKPEMDNDALPAGTLQPVDHRLALTTPLDAE
ncbi:energy transducer TonB [Dyella amyloliquefaciens]|uniref:energy transducer TonB n=1 Tax=Dyella amyloliquefaciens TaxID=1770545 RepID=UPI00102ECA6F|nr:energy transducer TonB [Dyella amyloliquefaciens]